jgi:hypothetical protein
VLSLEVVVEEVEKVLQFLQEVLVGVVMEQVHLIVEILLVEQTLVEVVVLLLVVVILQQVALVLL